MYSIYLVTNKVNGKKYVGITKYSITTRFEQHTRRGFLLTKAIKKYGVDSFDVELLETVDSIDAAYELECEYIKKYQCKEPSGYNLTDGGLGMPGAKITPQQRLSQSEAVKKLHVEKRVGMHGRRHTEKTKAKMSLAGKGKPRPWLIGRKHSEESIEKMRLAQQNRPLTSEETKRKISENHADIKGEKNPMYGKKHSPETIEKIRAIAKERLASTKNPNTKLNDAQIIEIYNLAWNGNLSQRQIGEMFDVSLSTVGDIKRGKRWGLVTNHAKHIGT